MHVPTLRMTQPNALGVLAAATFAITGCANMSGVGGSSEYSCKAPEGVRCESVSGNYYNAIQKNLPSQRLGRELPPDRSSDDAAPTGLRAGSLKPLPASQPTARAAHMPTALRAQPRVLRLWYKPWEDIDRDLNDQGYVYVQTDNGRWLIDHAHQRIRDAYTPIRPPRRLPASGAQTVSNAAVSRPPLANTEDDAAGNSAAKALDSFKRAGQTTAPGEDQ